MLVVFAMAEMKRDVKGKHFADVAEGEGKNDGGAAVGHHRRRQWNKNLSASGQYFEGD